MKDLRVGEASIMYNAKKFIKKLKKYNVYILCSIMHNNISFYYNNLNKCILICFNI